MPKPVAEVGEGHDDASGNGVYCFIRDLIVEGRDARFVNKKGRYVINWSRALKCYHDYKSKRNPQYKSKNINRRKASNGLRAALLNFYKKEGAKEYKDCKKVNERDEVIERQFQMPPRVFESLFGSDVQLSDDSSEHETSSIASEADEKPLVTPNSSDTGFDEAMNISDEPSSHCTLDGSPTGGDPLHSNVKTEEDQFDPSDIITPCQMFDISEEELDSALGEICSNSDNDIDLLGVVRDICPSSGSVKGGLQFYISLTEELSEDDKSGIAHFDGIGDVSLEKLNCYTLAGIIPASQQPGPVPVTVNTQDGRLLGMTCFLYVDEIQEVLKQLVNDPALQSLYFAMWSQQHGFCGSDGNISPNLGPFTFQDQGSSIQGTHTQALKVLQLLVYTAAQTNAQQFIQMIFSTSAGRLVFNAYKDRPQLPEDVARANGHDDLAQYLLDVSARLLEESSSDAQPNAIDWLELIEAVNKIQKQSSCIEDDDNQSDYFADAETSSCGSFDLEIGWSDSEDAEGPCLKDGRSNKESDLKSTPSMNVMPCEASAEVETQSDNDKDLEGDNNYVEPAKKKFEIGGETQKRENTSDREQGTKKKEKRTKLKRHHQSIHCLLYDAIFLLLLWIYLIVLTMYTVVPDIPTEGQVLHWAVRNGHIRISGVLMKLVSNVDAPNFRGETPLHVATKNGYKDLAELLMKLGSNVNAKNYRQQTPLHLAAWSGCQEITDALIRHGSDVKARDDFQDTALHLAAWNGHRDVLEVLVQQGSDVNAENRLRWTPLHLAAAFGYKETVDVLVQHGSDINIKNNLGYTPLHLAAVNGHLQMVRFLIQGGSDVEARDDTFQLSALHVAAIYGRKQIAKLLIHHGGDVNAVDRFGRTPLHLAAQKGHRKVAGVLIQNGSDVNARDTFGQTPLLKAARSGDQEIVEFLLQLGSELEAQDDSQQTPLHLAAQSGHKNNAEVFIRFGSDVNARDIFGQSPLHLAAQNGHKNIAKVLIRSGSDINARDIFGQSPLHLAARIGQQQIIEFLLQHGSELMALDDSQQTPLHLAAQNGHKNIAEVFIRFGSDINARDTFGQSPLHLATRSGQQEIIEFLLQHGSELKAQDDSQQTPLHLAAQNGHKNVVEVLIRYGSDVNVKNTFGETPLHVSVRGGHTQIVEVFLHHGSDVKACDGFQQTPLHLAAGNGHYKIAEALIRYRSDGNARDIFGHTPLHLAVQNGHKNVTEVLIRCGSVVNFRNQLGDTALHLAAWSGYQELMELINLINLKQTPNHLDPRNAPGITWGTCFNISGSGRTLEDLFDEELRHTLNISERKTPQTSSELLRIHWEFQARFAPVNLSIGLGDDVSGPRDHKLKLANQSFAQCLRICPSGRGGNYQNINPGLVIKYQGRCETACKAKRKNFIYSFPQTSCMLCSTKLATNGRPQDVNEGKIECNEEKISHSFGFADKSINPNKVLIGGELPLKEIANEGHHLVEASVLVPLIMLVICSVIIRTAVAICIALCRLYCLTARVKDVFKQKFPNAEDYQFKRNLSPVRVSC